MESEIQWKKVYLLGGVMTIIGLIGILLDVAIGSITGGDLSALPQTAVDRFMQFQENPLLGLYNLDLLNITNQIILIPAYYALFAAHRNVKFPYAGLALIIFLVGSIIFISTNTALPMFELSKKYAVATTESQKALYAAAGESMLARGEHGSLGVFIGFVLPNIAGLIFSIVMLTGKIFNKATSYLGIAGSSLLIVYLILVTFTEGESMATALAMPGGLMSIAWMILFAIKLIKLGNENATQSH